MCGYSAYLQFSHIYIRVNLTARISLQKCCNSKLFYFLSLTSFRDDFSKTRNIYERLGQFDFQNPDCTQDIIEANGANKEGVKRVYIGQTKAGTSTFDGIGIVVWADGGTLCCIDNHCIYEGYFKDHMINGPGRHRAGSE